MPGEEELLSRQMPHSTEAEQSVLGSMLIDARCVPEVIEALKPEDFYLRTNREIYETIYSMFNFSLTIDPVTVLEHMRQNGVYDENTSRNYILQLMEITPTAANVKEYVAIVKDKALLRRIAETAGELTALVQEGTGTGQEVLEAAEQRIYAIRQGRAAQGLTHISSVILGVYERLNELAASDQAVPGLSTGLPDVDMAISGLNKSDLILLAARPDFILASCNTTADLELESTFENAGIPTAYFDIQNFDDYLNMLEICTGLTGCPENYETYGLQVQEQVEAAKARQDGSAPTVLTIRATGSSCKVKGSQDFLLGEMLSDLGCVNVADSETSLLEELSLEAILAADPDYIFVVLQGSDATDAQETLEKTLLSNPAWGGLRAVQEGRFHTLEHSLYNLKPNARWGEAYEKLADILYP